MSISNEVARRFGTWVVGILPVVGIVSLYFYWQGPSFWYLVPQVVTINAFTALNALCIFVRLKAVSEELARRVALLALMPSYAYLSIRLLLKPFEDPGDVVSFFFYYSCGVAALNLALYLFYRPSKARDL